jgi:hypothetical protein
MQFSLKHLLLWVSLICCLMAVVFSPPIKVSLIALCCLHLISPAVWITGMRYSQGRLQVFNWAGFMTGVAPWLAGIYMWVAVSISGWSDGSVFGEDSTVARLYLLLIWSSSGIVAILGGLLGLVIYQFIKPESPQQPVPENRQSHNTIPQPKFLDSAAHATLTHETSPFGSD